MWRVWYVVVVMDEGLAEGSGDSVVGLEY